MRFLDYVKNPAHADMWVFAANSLIVVLIFLFNYFKSTTVRDLLTLHVGTYFKDKDLRDRRILYLPDMVATLIQSHTFYLYAHLGSVERFWTAMPVYYLMLLETQLLLNRQAARSRYHSALRYALVVCMVGRFAVTPVFYVCRIVPV